ncbi:MAG TPA: hypothetical protein VGM90_14950 [Kofleriaceae bacterium]|jgi:hypothetical protein
MPKYRIHVTHTIETGTRSPAEPHVVWSARRIVEPITDLGRHDMLGHYTPNERSGILGGVYDSIKHAESLGETLTLDDLECTVEHVTVKLEGGKPVDARRRTENHVSVYRGIFEEIMARPRPLP